MYVGEWLSDLGVFGVDGAAIGSHFGRHQLPSRQMLEYTSAIAFRPYKGVWYASTKDSFAGISSEYICIRLARPACHAFI